MAVSKMLRLTVLGHRPVMPGVLDAVQRAGLLEIESHTFDLPSEELEPDDERRLRVDEQTARAQFVRDFIARYHVPTHALATFVSEKIHVDEGRFTTLVYDTHVHRVYRECVTLSDRIAHAERERERLRALIRDLEPWRELRFEIGRWEGTERTALFTGLISCSSADAVRQRLRAEFTCYSIEELAPVGDRQAWVVFAHRSCAEAIRALLAQHGFTPVAFPGLVDYPAEEIESARDRIREHEASIAASHERAAELAAEHYEHVFALVQLLESERDRLVALKDVARTERTFIIEGWIEEAETGRIEEALAPFGGSLDLTLRPPNDDEEPPVALRNPRWLKPFEILTDLYGRPAYRGIDPTPLFAPFFLLFFSLCVGDVGYGLMLMAAAWLIKNRLDVGHGVKRFMDLVALGGFGSILLGIALGSYFALPSESLPQALRALQFMNPIEDIERFLMIGLVVGFVQVTFGVILAAYSAFRRGDPEAAVFDQISILFLFAMVGATVLAGTAGNSDLVRASLVIGIVGTMAMQGRAVQLAVRGDGAPAWDRLLGVTWAAAFVAAFFGYALSGRTALVWGILGVSSIGLVASRSVRRGVVGLLSGAYNVYGLTGFFGDVLSYLRLPALGLSGTLVGLIFNILTGLVWSSAAPFFEKGGVSWLPGVVVALLAVVLFGVGHTFNVTINLLGAFVHPARLQFVEFFSKFYEAGGRPFSPLRLRTDGLALDARTAGAEGGRVS